MEKEEKVVQLIRQTHQNCQMYLAEASLVNIASSFYQTLIHSTDLVKVCEWHYWLFACK